MNVTNLSFLKAEMRIIDMFSGSLQPLFFVIHNYVLYEL